MIRLCVVFVVFQELTHFPLSLKYNQDMIISLMANIQYCYNVHECTCVAVHVHAPKL